MPLTVADIYTKLGLDDPKVWAKKAVQKNRELCLGQHAQVMGVAEIYVRRTGRTTLLIVRALVQVSKGRMVIFTARTQDYAKDMTRKARKWAKQLGLEERLILEPGHVAVFRDHDMP